MKRLGVTALLFLMTGISAAAQAQDPTRAVGLDVFVSSDADHSDVLKVGLNFNFAFTDLEHYQGGRLETFTFSSPGSPRATRTRGYYLFADTGERWKWNGAIGTDGRSVLGNGSLYAEGDFRQEYFFSRDLVETPLGISRGLYSNYLGAAYDMPLDDRNTVTALVGVQQFDGKNWRGHLRGRYIHAVNPDWGLTAQLRTRYFYNSSPREYDYFSPRYYAEVIPTLQLRRFYQRWQYSFAVGWGGRRDADADWKSAVLAEAMVVTPSIGQDWYMKAAINYSNTPVSTGSAYSYQQFSLSLLKKF